jgi:hypothetical protein
MIDDAFDVIVCLIASFFCAMLGFVVGVATTSNSGQKEAVKAGVAEYYLDANNERQFRFKEAK